MHRGEDIMLPLWGFIPSRAGDASELLASVCPLVLGRCLNEVTQSCGRSLQHLHFLKEQMQFMACPSFFLLSPLSTWNLYSLYARSRAKAVKNYSLHFQFSEFVRAFYFPVCWVLFSKAACCEASLSRPCNLKIWGLLLHAECLFSTCHSSPTLAELGGIWGPLCPHSHLCWCFSTLLEERGIFETQVYYTGQGLSLLNYYRCQRGKLQTHKSPVPPCGGSGYWNCWGCCEDLRRRRREDLGSRSRWISPQGKYKKLRTLFNSHSSTRTKKNKSGVSPLQVNLQQLQVRDGRAAEERKIVTSRGSQRLNCKYRMAGWTDPQQHGIGAKGEDDKLSNVHSADHLVWWKQCHCGR